MIVVVRCSSHRIMGYSEHRDTSALALDDED
jgi:hypothetical protein